MKGKTTTTTVPGRSAPMAYPVPWRVDRSRAPTYHLVNVSDEALRGVTLNLGGSAVMRASPPRSLQPGDLLSVTIRGRDLARNTVLVVRWFRPDGLEYLWRVSF